MQVITSKDNEIIKSIKNIRRNRYEKVGMPSLWIYI